MGIRYTRTRGGRTDGSSYHQMAAKLSSIIEEEMDQAGRDGRDEARRIVETSGTGRVWSGPFRGRSGSVRTESGPGRVDTGHMRDALDYRITRGRDVGLDVGWIRIWEEYFGAQDRGFSSPGYRNAPLAVEGMGVMAHLHVFMRGRVDEALDRATERIVNGL
jgi:hypothetical protein